MWPSLLLIFLQHETPICAGVYLDRLSIQTMLVGCIFESLLLPFHIVLRKLVSSQQTSNLDQPAMSSGCET